MSNNENYSDRTAEQAIAKADKELKTREKQLIKIVVSIIHFAGYEIVGQIRIRRKK